MGETEAVVFQRSKEIEEIQREVAINFTSQYKYLGVTLDPTLTLDIYLGATYKKAAAWVHLLRRIRRPIDTSTAILIFNAMVMPLFIYRELVGLGWQSLK